MLYVVGGGEDFGDSVACVDSYVTHKDEWTSVKSMLTPRWEPGTC